MSSNSSLVPLIRREIITERSWEGLTLVGPSMNTSILQKKLRSPYPPKMSLFKWLELAHEYIATQNSTIVHTSANAWAWT